MNRLIDYYRKQSENEELDNKERSNFVAAMWSHIRQLTSRNPIVVRDEDE